MEKEKRDKRRIAEGCKRRGSDGKEKVVERRESLATDRHVPLISVKLT